MKPYQKYEANVNHLRNVDFESTAMLVYLLAIKTIIVVVVFSLIAMIGYSIIKTAVVKSGLKLSPPLVPNPVCDPYPHLNTNNQVEEYPVRNCEAPKPMPIYYYGE